MMDYSEIKEFDLKLSGKSGSYQGILFHELAGNPAERLPEPTLEIFEPDLYSWIIYEKFKVRFIALFNIITIR